MPANKDPDSPGKWLCQFYYTDWTGQRKKKRKRGFATKREALEWEREFLKKTQADLNMRFDSFLEIYLQDAQSRIRETTMHTKRSILESQILPYFREKPVGQITPADIRQWQSVLMEKGYSPSYLRTVQNHLTAVFNFAVRYYHLPENPCTKAGPMGRGRAGEMQFWTLEEYKTFREALRDKPAAFVAFETLYYTGMRVGELLALTRSDIDTSAGTISINKTFTRLDRQDVITPPKTPKSKRVLLIPAFLCRELEEYLGSLYGLGPDERVFPFTKHLLTYEMKRGCKLSGVKQIRLHDIRHSHASLLIELGFSPLLIAERLGHEKVETTLNTYSHLWPNKQTEVAAQLDALG